VNEPVLLQPRESARDDFANRAGAPRDVLVVEREVYDEAFVNALAARPRFGQEQASEPLPDFPQAEDFDQLGAASEASGNQFEGGERNLRVQQAEAAHVAFVYEVDERVDLGHRVHLTARGALPTFR
jgi:hypothetical protein